MRARANAVSRTRQQIVQRAAEQLRASPEPVTLAGIAAAAGVSRTTVYRHFRSITGLLDAVAADLLSRARFDQLLAAVGLPEPPLRWPRSPGSGVASGLVTRTWSATCLPWPAPRPMPCRSSIS